MIQSRTLYVTGDPYFAGYSADLGSGLSSPNTNIKLGSFYYNGNIGYLYKNTSLITSGVLTFISPSTPYISAGVSFPITPNNEYLNGYITEILMYSSDQSQNRLAIEKNVNSYYSIY
jgi:hypothetical protein